MQQRQCRGLCAHPLHKADKCTGHHCDNRLPAACHAWSRSSLGWRLTLPPACAFWKRPTHSEAASECCSKRPDTPGKTWQLSASSQSRSHTLHPLDRLPPSQEGCPAFLQTPLSTGRQALCSCSAQVLWQNCIYTGDSCKHLAGPPGSSSRLYSPCSSCDHSGGSRVSSAHPNIWSKIKNHVFSCSQPSSSLSSSFRFLWKWNTTAQSVLSDKVAPPTNESVFKACCAFVYF